MSVLWNIFFQVRAGELPAALSRQPSGDRPTRVGQRTEARGEAALVTLLLSA